MFQKFNIGTIFMDLYKAFDTLNHDLLLAKWYADGFSANAIAYIKSYLSNRYQRTNINNKFSPWKNICKAVPQCSSLGPLLFNIFINNCFILLKIVIYAIMLMIIHCMHLIVTWMLLKKNYTRTLRY